MSTADIIQSISVFATIIFSLIALVQSIKSKKDVINANENADKANKLSEKANDVSKESIKEAQISNEKADSANTLAQLALDDSRKNFMPLVRFTGDFNVLKKSVFTLRNEVTFDFNELILDLENSFVENGFEHDDELVCVEAKIENCGNGIITGIEIKDFFIQSGNKVSIRKESQEPNESLCSLKKCSCEEEFVLIPGEKSVVNFIVTKNLMDRNNFDFCNAQKYFEKFVDNYNNIMISMSLDIKSINKSTYHQEYLWGTYFNQKLVLNSFSETSCIDS